MRELAETRTRRDVKRENFSKWELPLKIDKEINK